MGRIVGTKTTARTDPAWIEAMDELALRWREQSSERQQGRSRQRERDILEAAQRVLSREGLGRVRIADVAAEAGMPQSSIYEYFQSKEDLAYAVPVVRLGHFFSEYAEKARGLTCYRDRLRFFLWLSSDFARRNPDWARTLYLEIWPSVMVSDSPVRPLLDDYGRFIVQLIRAGTEKGEWPDSLDPYETVAILIGSHNQLLITWLLYRKPKDIMRAMNSMLDRLLVAILPQPPESPPEAKP